MCGISGYVTTEGPIAESTVRAMAHTVTHRGPDGEGVWVGRQAGLGNRRLAVLDLSPRGHQPMTSQDGRYVITYNGEVYNYLELKDELGISCHTGTDTEVVLEAFARLGLAGVSRLNGMFAFAVWDTVTATLYLIRDRFGVKPLYYSDRCGQLYFGSEVKALAAGGVGIEPDDETWATYLRSGAYDHSARSFFRDIKQVPPGHYLVWRNGSARIHPWYDLGDIIVGMGPDGRRDADVMDEYHELLKDAVRLRFRSDVPVGICLSGGLDSSTLIGVLGEVFGSDHQVQSYHFACGDPLYDETPWVRSLLRRRPYPLHIVPLRAEDVPDLAHEALTYQEAPFGGIPTLAMTQLFRAARESGTIVLLDGQGLDEQWAGYGYYAQPTEHPNSSAMPVQGSVNGGTHEACLSAYMRSLPIEPAPLERFGDRLLALRYRDLRYTKLPRALRFNDRASSQSSCELREPFLDYRLVELAFRQPAHRLIRNGEHKYLLRRLVTPWVPQDVREAPKRPVQTPQREWLRGPLRGWVESCLSDPVMRDSGWFDVREQEIAWRRYLEGRCDNGFHVWQWISVVLNRRFIDTVQAQARNARAAVVH